MIKINSQENLQELANEIRNALNKDQNLLLSATANSIMAPANWLMIFNLKFFRIQKTGCSLIPVKQPKKIKDFYL